MLPEHSFFVKKGNSSKGMCQGHVKVMALNSELSFRFTPPVNNLAGAKTAIIYYQKDAMKLKGFYLRSKKISV